MHSSHRLDRPTRSQRATAPERGYRKVSTEVEAANRQEWVTACASRLAALQPGVDMGALLTLAADLWNDLGGHDPEIAAEMEQESRGSDE